ncbi:hypothetical protein MNBD_GAMMA22-3030 [hydrothermal vent metagenome]|uniref:Uncharacterized protein n=1 Tax=hydrothermal vent metagenome TaxID=652676 RepID=A0A3B0ZH75_9ZZZZ
MNKTTVLILAFSLMSKLVIANEFGSTRWGNYVSPDYNPYEQQFRPEYRQVKQQRHRYLATPYSSMHNSYYPITALGTELQQPLFFGNPYFNYFPLALPPAMLPVNSWINGWPY